MRLPGNPADWQHGAGSLSRAAAANASGERKRKAPGDEPEGCAERVIA
jgi:hypothetical protein